MSTREPKVFLDTNILVYTFDASSPRKRAQAQRLLARALEGRNAVISWQVVQEFLNVATRKFSRPMQPAEAQFYLTRVLMPLCEVFPNESLYSAALSVADETGFSFYDSLILASALAAECALVLSEDLAHGQTVRGLKIRNPFLERG